MNEQSMVANPMAPIVSRDGASNMPATRSAAAAALQTRANRLVEIQIEMAIRFPRDVVAACENVLQECATPALAENAEYSYVRGGTDITGATVHLLRAIARHWKNLNYGFDILTPGRESSEVMAFAHDMESNVSESIVFTVSHYRHTRKGTYLLEDPRDIYEKIANEAARRERKCMESLIPVGVVESAREQCRQTMRLTADITPENIKKMVEAFAELGVTTEQIEAKIQRRVASINEATMVRLKRFYKAIADGIATADNIFGSSDEIEPEAEEKTQKSAGRPSVADNIKKQVAATGSATGVAGQLAEPSADAEAQAVAKRSERARKAAETRKRNAEAAKAKAAADTEAEAAKQREADTQQGQADARHNLQVMGDYLKQVDSAQSVEDCRDLAGLIPNEDRLSHPQQQELLASLARMEATFAAPTSDVQGDGGRQQQERPEGLPF